MGALRGADLGFAAAAFATAAFAAAVLGFFVAGFFVAATVLVLDAGALAVVFFAGAALGAFAGAALVGFVGAALAGLVAAFAGGVTFCTRVSTRQRQGKKSMSTTHLVGLGGLASGAELHAARGA